jgi:hypothetical protein
MNTLNLPTRRAAAANTVPPSGGAPQRLTCTLPRAGDLRARSVLLVAVFVTLLGGCTVEPWVKPYQRDKLADPVMSLDQDRLSDRMRQHMYDATEAAQGTTAVRGGGCGCP